MYPNLVVELAKKKKSESDVAFVLGLSNDSIRERMNGKKDFKLRECKLIIDRLLPGHTIDYLFMTSGDCKIEEGEKGK